MNDGLPPNFFFRNRYFVTQTYPEAEDRLKTLKYRVTKCINHGSQELAYDLFTHTVLASRGMDATFAAHEKDCNDDIVNYSWCCWLMMREMLSAASYCHVQKRPDDGKNGTVHYHHGVMECMGVLAEGRYTSNRDFCLDVLHGFIQDYLALLVFKAQTNSVIQRRLYETIINCHLSEPNQANHFWIVHKIVLLTRLETVEHAWFEGDVDLLERELRRHVPKTDDPNEDLFKLLSDHARWNLLFLQKVQEHLGLSDARNIIIADVKERKVRK